MFSFSSPNFGSILNGLLEEDGASYWWQCIESTSCGVSGHVRCTGSCHFRCLLNGIAEDGARK